MIKFEWDSNKNDRNFKKRGLDFEDAVIVFSGPTIHMEDQRENYGESRWIVYGLLMEVVVVIVYTVRGDRIRIISMRRATKKEQRQYEQSIREQETIAFS
jgi:uncharacterized DUF497 family protein